MSIKYKILETALDLFNKEGVDKVSSRRIAAELKISDGNLRYHFKHKELIIIQLFEQMQEELNQNREAKRQSAHTLGEILDSMKSSFEIQYKYRFLLINLVDICRNIEYIHHHYQQSKALWKNYFLENVNKMLENGYIAVENDEEQKLNYFAICNMISNFWALDADLFGEGNTENVVDHYFKINCSLVKPYLTPKGKEEFQAYFVEVT
ncbi:MAG: TetR/AcrR family transcriptional regulator [Microscillaceae bacterium]|nr:TetR/AcrR family transcriptional regulator [Microscillaceae bacterium]